MTVQLQTIKNWINNLDPSKSCINYELNEKNLVDKVWCSLCKRHADRLKCKRNFSSAFIIGIGGSALKKDNVVKHMKSDMHLSAVNFDQKPSTIAQLMQTMIGKSLNRIEDKEKDRVGKLIDIAYFVAKEELPYSIFPRVAELEKRHGVQLADTYINRKKCAEFIDCIAKTMTKDLCAELANSNYISVLLDESTDVSTCEKILVYVKYINFGGNMQTKFVALRNVISGNAADLKIHLLRILEDYGIDFKKKLVAFCSDGANVNLGIRQGLATRLKEDCPWLVIMHCLNHRLELAVKDSIKDTYFETVIRMMTNLYSYYKLSPKRRREMQELSDILEEQENTETYNPTNINGTRWIDYKKRAAIALLKSYALIISHLENTVSETGSEKALKTKIKGYLKILKSRKFVYHLLLMEKIYNILSKLCLALQEDSCDLLHATTCLHKLEHTLQNLTADDEDTSSCTISAVQKGEPFAGISLTGTGCALDAVTKYCTELNECIKHRFLDMKSELLQCMKILDITMWPSEMDSLMMYGNKEIELLKKHFETLLLGNNVALSPLSQIDEEWNELKVFWYQSLKYFNRHDLWTFVLRSNRGKFPNLAHLFEILLVFPVSNAVVERGFSYMARIKTGNRNKLQEDSLENLARVSIEGPAIEAFSPEEAQKIFFETPRRPNTLLCGKRKRDCISD